MRQASPSEVRYDNYHESTASPDDVDDFESQVQRIVCALIEKHPRFGALPDTRFTIANHVREALRLSFHTGTAIGLQFAADGTDATAVMLPPGIVEECTP